MRRSMLTALAVAACLFAGYVTFVNMVPASTITVRPTAS